MKFVLIASLLALATIVAWVIIAGIEHRRELDQLEEDYLARHNESFINPFVNTQSEDVEDLAKEESYLNYLNDEKENK